MRLHVKHQTVYQYEKPVSYTIQSLRVSPRPHEGLIVLNWRVQADGQRDLPSFVDGFGNIVHCRSVNRPMSLSGCWSKARSRRLTPLESCGVALSRCLRLSISGRRC